MAVVGSAEVAVRPSFTGMQRQVAGAAATMNKQLGAAGPTIGQRVASGIGTALKRSIATVGAAAGVTLGYALFKGFERLKAIDQAEAKLTGLGHTTRGVDKIMSNALSSVKGTAFGLDEAATVASSTVAAGVKPGKELESTLRLVADAATIGGTSMNDMGAIFNKVAASNKVQGDVINQLNERGIPIVQFLSKELGVSAEKVTELASKGKIDFATFRKAMESGLGGAAKSSGKTFTGALANLQASLGRIGAGLLGGVFPHFAPALMKITDAMGPLEDMAAKVGDKIGKMLVPAVSSAAGWLGRAATKVGAFTSKLDFSSWDAFLSSAKGAGGGALAGLGSTFASIGESMKTLGPPIRDLLSQLPALGTAAGEGVASGIRILARVLEFAANNMKLTMAIVVPLVAAYAAWRVAQAATARTTGMLTAAQLAMTPVTLTNNVIRLRAITLERQHAIATGQYTAAQNTSRISMVKNIAVSAAHRTATIASTVATKAAAVAQRGLNLAMRMNPIGLIITGIMLLVAGFILAYKKSETFRKIVNGALYGIKVAAGAVGRFFTKTLPAAFGAVIGWVKANWPLILSILTGPIGAAVIAIIRNRKRIMDGFKSLVGWVRGVFSRAWGKLQQWIVQPVVLGMMQIRRTIRQIQLTFLRIKLWMQKTWSRGWNAVKGWVSKPVDAGRKAVGTTTDKLRSGLNRMKDWGKRTWSRSWSGMEQVISDPVGSARKIIDSQQGRIRRVLNTLDGWGKKIFGKRWGKMRDTFTAPIKAVVRYFRNVFGPGGGGVRKIFSDAVGALGRIWDRVKGLMTKPLRFVVNTVINKGILGALRRVAGFVGMEDKVPSVNWGKLTGAARGTILPGQSSWRQGDDQLIGARRGEGVFVSEGLRDRKSRDLFLGANKAARTRGTSLADYVHGLAQGGLVGGSGRFSPRATQTLLRAQQLAGVPFSIFQRGFRPTTSYSGTSHAGDAIDTGPVTSRVVAALRSAGWAAWDRTGKGNWVPHIHGVPLPGAGFAGGSGVWQAQDYLRGGDGLGGRDQGPRGMLDRVKGWLKTGVGAIKGVGGAIGQAMPDLAGMFKRLTGKAFKGWQQFAGSPFADIVKALPQKLITSGMDWVKEKAAALSPFGGGQNYGADKMGIAKTIASTARNLGLGDRGAIIGLITGIVESGLRNVNYGDRDSLGVFQQRSAWGPRSARMNPAQAAHMFFTGGQAGQPGLMDYNWRSMGMGEAAQKVQVSAHPSRYGQRIGEARSILDRLSLNRDSGGRLPTGTSLVHNGTGRDEQVVTGSQWDAITNGTGKVEINVNVQGGVVDDRTADRIAEALERRMRRKGPTKITTRSRP